jgi:hypothetical protein
MQSSLFKNNAQVLQYSAFGKKEKIIFTIDRQIFQIKTKHLILNQFQMKHF